MSNRLRPRGRRPLGLGVLLAAIASIALLPPGVAQARPFSSSTITSPANGTVLFDNADQGAGSVTVQGSVSPAAAGIGHLLCYTSTGPLSGFDVTISIGASGAFGATVPLTAIRGQACVLRFVPPGAAPSASAAGAFAGPIINVSSQQSYAAGGVLYGYDVVAGVASFAYDLGSVGECAIRHSYVTDLSALSFYGLFSGNLCLPQSSGVAPNPGTRSAVQIDGLNAYPPAAIQGLTNLPGFLPLSYSVTWSGGYSQVTIAETDSLMYCAPPGGYPPAGSSCPSLLASGVVLHQTASVLGNGQIARVTEKFVDVDGKPHGLDLLLNQSVRSPVAGAPPGFEFPGQSVFASHLYPDSFALFPHGPGTIYVIADAAVAPGIANPIGAITYEQPPSSAEFESAANAQLGRFAMHYVAHLRANGSVSYQWSFAQAAGAQTLTQLAGAERDRFFTPRLRLTRPRAGSVVRYSPVAVGGIASDRIGIALVTINGHVVNIGRGGRFSALDRLHRGRNRIVARVSNLGGITSSRTLTVRYRPGPCVVPALQGKRLGSARMALLTHGCTLGSVRLRHSHTIPRGRVIRSLPQTGGRRPHGTRVALFISDGPR
jgi:hypothetical protein